MRCKSRDRQRARPEIGGEFGQQCARLGWCHLVLNRDVQSRLPLVLRGQHAGKMIGDALADLDQVGTVDAEGYAAAKRIDVSQTCGRRRHVGGNAADQPVEFIDARRRQLVEQGDVRREMIALGREMRGAQIIEMKLVRRTHRRGHDDGHGASGPDGRGGCRAA